MARRIKLGQLRALLAEAINRADDTAKLARSENPQSRAVGLRAEGRADAYRDMLCALNYNLASMNIAAGRIS